MDSLQLTTSITVLANAIARVVDDDGALNLLGATITQLGDTVTTIATQRDFCSKTISNAKDVSSNN